MKEVQFTNEIGRNFIYSLPDDAPDEDVEMGHLMGPPDIVGNLELPEPFATQLHNELLNRGLLSYEDVRQNPKSLQGALQAVLKLDVQRLYNAYLQEDRAIKNGR